VRHAVKRQEMMHAQRVKRDRADEHELVMAALVGERRRAERLRGEQLRIGVDHPPRTLARLLAHQLRAERDEQLGSCPLGGSAVDRAALNPRLGGQLETARILDPSHTA
jgi:hypothetical protein